MNKDGYDEIDWPLGGLFTHKAFKCQKCDWIIHWTRGMALDTILSEHRRTHEHD